MGNIGSLDIALILLMEQFLQSLLYIANKRLSIGKDIDTKKYYHWQLPKKLLIVIMLGTDLNGFFVFLHHTLLCSLYHSYTALLQICATQNMP